MTSSLLAIATSCYSFCDVEFMETQITIAIPTELDSISPMQLAKHQAKMMEAFLCPVVFALESVGILSDILGLLKQRLISLYLESSFSFQVC